MFGSKGNISRPGKRALRMVPVIVFLLSILLVACREDMLPDQAAPPASPTESAIEPTRTPPAPIVTLPLTPTPSPAVYPTATATTTEPATALTPIPSSMPTQVPFPVERVSAPAPAGECPDWPPTPTPSPMPAVPITPGRTPTPTLLPTPAPPAGGCGPLCESEFWEKVVHSHDPEGLVWDAIACGADPALWRRLEPGHNPLKMAIGRMQHPGLVRLLLRHGADPNGGAEQGTDDLATPLHLAVAYATYFSRPENGQDFLDRYRDSFRALDPNDVPRWFARRTPDSLLSDSVEVVRLLLEHGAEPSIRGRSERTPLEAHAYLDAYLYLEFRVGGRGAGRHNADVIRLLLKHSGGRVGQYGYDPFIAALTLKVAGTDLVRILVEDEVRSSMDPEWFKTIPHRFAYAGIEDPEMYETLFAGGADPWASDFEGMTACERLRQDSIVKDIHANHLGRRLDLTEAEELLCGPAPTQPKDTGRREWGDGWDPAIKYSQVSVSKSHTCALHEDGRIECWGREDDGGMAPPGEFISVTAGYRHTCALRADETVNCWGNNDLGQSAAPSGKFRSISAGTGHTCAVNLDGAVVCWGSNHRPSLGTGRPYTGQSSPPAGKFSSVSSGYTHSCGIREDGFVTCWGEDAIIESTPTLRAISTSAGDRYTCAVAADASVVCWGWSSDDIVGSTPTSGVFTSVDVSDTHACGVKDSGEVVCWGEGYWGADLPPPGKFVSVSTGGRFSCGLKGDGSLACWGGDVGGASSPPGGQFSSVSAGSIHNCGLRPDGTASCWGYDYQSGEPLVQATPPDGQFIQIDSGNHYTCGLRPDSSVVCWGWDDEEAQSRLPGEFVSVDAGIHSICGIRTDGSAVCWGILADFYDAPPPGVYVSISVGQFHACAIKADGSVVCWGDEYFFEDMPLSEEFSSVSAAGSHTCGLRTDGSVVCWGDLDREDDIERNPPGEFISINTGGNYACGVGRDNTIACWGDVEGYELKPPVAWKFTSVSIGGDHACGIRTSGAVACWGGYHGADGPPYWSN